MASIATYSGVVRDGKIELADKIALPEGIEVFVVVPAVIDEDTARRKINGWLLSEVGNMLMADHAKLVNLDGSLIWRLRVYLTSSAHEPRGPIGNVLLNATSGQILGAEDTAKRLRTYGKQAEHPILSSAG
jgi:hypothetical protein